MMGSLPLKEEEESRASPCVDTARRQPDVKQEMGSHQDPNHAGPLISDFQLPELSEINFCCLSHTIYGIFVVAACAKTLFKVIFLVAIALEPMFLTTKMN